MKTAILEELRALCRDECVKAGGWSQLSRKIGVPRTKLRSLMEGHDPLLRNFVEILEAMDSSLRMIKGRLEEEARRHADSPARGLSSPLMVRADDGDPEYVRIPQLNTKAERSGTRAPTGGAIAFRRDWLRARSLDVERLAVMQMHGDWMHPTLSDGDWALVDQGVGHRRGSLVVAWTQGQLTIRRLERVGKRWHLTSDNLDYAPVALDSVGHIIGRAVWRSTWL